MKPPPTLRMAASELPVIDTTALDGIRQLDDSSSGLLTQVIQVYFESAAQLLGDLRRGLESKDIELVKRAAHTLKSSSANLGALRLSDLCRRIEAAARSGTLGADLPGADEIDAEFAQVRAALERENA